MMKPRKQTYTLNMYLEKMREEDIRSDADVQRLFVWNNEQVNELIVTILTDDYIPPIILGEESSSQLWIIDGGQRSAALMKYKYGNYKITSAVEDSEIVYKVKSRDKDGNLIRDDKGDIVWEEAVFDIRNKTYNDLPDELKKAFNEYQIETVIHEKCGGKRISKLIKRYNNHTAMNASQKAFTYIDNYAREIRNILDTDFFSKRDLFTENERAKGVLERVVLESVMCTFHLEYWKKQPKQIAAYLNVHAGKDEFARLNDNICRLNHVLTDEVKDIFNSKDTFIWLSLFNKFTELGIEDEQFVHFLKAFKEELREKHVEGKLFDGIDRERGRGTKDKAVIMAKLNILETLMYDFFQIDKETGNVDSLLKFVRQQVSEAITREDVELYETVLDDLTRNADQRSELLDFRNRLSLVALVAWSFLNDVDLEEWMVWFFQEHVSYIRDQKKNYLYMIEEVGKFLKDSSGVG